MSRNVAILFTLNIVLTVLLSTILVSEKFNRKTIQFIIIDFLVKKLFLSFLNYLKKKTKKSKFWLSISSKFQSIIFCLWSRAWWHFRPFRSEIIHFTNEEPRKKSLRITLPVKIDFYLPNPNSRLFYYLINWVADFHLNFFTRRSNKRKGHDPKDSLS